MIAVYPNISFYSYCKLLLYCRYLGLISSSQTDLPSEPHNEEDVDCSNFKFLAPRQKELCSKEVQLHKVIGDGAKRGIAECQNQFSNRRWNCSTFNTTDVFGKVLQLSK